MAVKKAKKINLGETIRVMRVKRGLTPAEMAQKTDISVSHLSNIESGRRDLPLKLAPVFGKILAANEKALVKLSIEQSIQRAKLSFMVDVRVK
jgi:transcriptional regulator with XRE-family HTH domain